MKERRNLIQLLFDQKRIELNTPHYKSLAFLSIAFIVLIESILTLLIGISVGIEIESLITLGLIWISGSLVANYIYRNLRSLSIKGDMVIMRSLNGKNDVIHIQSVRYVRSYHVLRIQFTFIKFRIDGTTRNVFAVTKTSMFNSTPEHTFRKALQISDRIK